MGGPVASRSAVACLAIDESQQPTCPHCAHRRRWNHQPSLAVHSTQPSLLGGTEGSMSTSCWSSMDAPSERPVERSSQRVLHAAEPRRVRGATPARGTSNGVLMTATGQCAERSTSRRTASKGEKCRKPDGPEDSTSRL